MRKSRDVKLHDKYTGYFGEGCWAPRGRRWIKRIEHKYNRRAQKIELNNEIQKELQA